MGVEFINYTTPWLSYASWTWEVLRRNPDYIAYYKALKNKAIETLSMPDGAAVLKANQHFPTANKFGLIAPADPSKFAGEEPVLWSPKVFANVVRFHVIDPSTVSRRQKPIQLSKMAGDKIHFLDANGTYHIRILGERFWFQLRSDTARYVSENAYIGFEINNIGNPKKRFETIKQIGEIYDGTTALDSRLHVPARLDSHLKTTLAYDIRSSGGTVSDVISAFIQAGYVTIDPNKYSDFKDAAQNAYRAGKAYISGDYFKIIDKQ